MREMNISYKGKSLGDVRSFIRMYYRCSTYIANEVAKQLIIEGSSNIKSDTCKDQDG